MGRLTLLGAGCPPTTGGGGGYQGPLDLQPTGAFVWVGLRAGSAARRGTAVVRIAKSSDSFASQADISTDAVTGRLDTSNAFFDGSTTYHVVTLYDQSGNGHDFTEGVDAIRPALVLGAIGTAADPVIRFNGASMWLEYVDAGGAMPVAQPYWVSTVIKSTTNAHDQGYFAPQNTDASIGFTPSDTAFMYTGVGNVLATSVTVNVWHAIQNVATGVSDGSSDIYVNSTSHLGNPGTNNLHTGLTIGKDAFSNFFLGDLVEIGLWQGLTVSSGDKSGMESNQQAFYAGM